MTADSGAPRVDLAREEDFRLGDLLVSPSTLQAVSGETPQTLEPRIMQVLVALARRRNEVVSRDELIESCWEGRIVGDDAVTRCISKIRKLGETGNAFRLETIPRVGYRLWPNDTTPPLPATAPAVAPAVAKVTAPPAPPPEPSSPARAAPRLSRRTQVLAAALAVAVAALVGWMTFGRPARAPLEPSVAVLPFANLSGDASKDYLAHGIASELIETMSQIDKLQVVGRGSSFSFKPDADPRVAGQALKVANVLSGSVSQEKDGMHISFELVETATGRAALSKTFTTQLTTDNLSGAQHFIAEQVAGALSIAFDVKGAQQLAGSGTRSMEAYDFYLRGVEVRERSPEEAENYFARAVEIDPNYAAAWGMRAISHGSGSWTRPTPAQGRKEQDEAYAMAQQAVKLDADNGPAQAVFGNLSTTQHKWSDADAASSRAVDLLFTDITLNQRQMILLRMGRLGDAEALARKLEQVSPGGLQVASIAIPAALGNMDQLRAVLQDPLWARANNVRDHLFKLDALVHLGEPKGVRGELELMANLPDRFLSEFAKAMLPVFDDKEKARATLRTWYESPGFETSAKYQLIPILAAFYGDTDLVLRVWRDDLPVNVVRMALIWGPAYAPARSQPGFKALMQDMGLVDYWRAAKWADKCRPVGADFDCG